MTDDCKDTTRLYLNLAAVNPITATSAQPAQINQQFDEDFLPNAADFDGSFVRLALPTDAIPYFDGATSGPWYVTLTWRNVDYKQQVNVIGWGASGSDLKVYYIQQFLDSVNTALATAYSAVTAANPTDYMLWPGHAPYIQWSPATQLCTMVTDVGTWEISSPFNSAIYFNTPLMHLFANMPSTFSSFNSASGKDAAIRIVNRGFNVQQPAQPVVAVAVLNAALVLNTTYTTWTVKALGSPGPLAGLPAGAQIQTSNGWTADTTFVPILSDAPSLSSAWTTGSTTMNVNTMISLGNASVGSVVQTFAPMQILTVDETPSVLNWCQLTRIIVKSQGNFPVRMELAPTNPTAPSGALKGEQIITDYIMDPQQRLGGQQILLMIPQPQYRWFDLKQEGKLRAADFQFYAANLDGSIQVPIMLTPGNGFNTKVLFDRKTVTTEHLDTYQRLKNCGGGAAALEAYDRSKRLKLGLR